jgi:hypothetical protein
MNEWPNDNVKIARNVKVSKRLSIQISSYNSGITCHWLILLYKELPYYQPAKLTVVAIP